ncbi:MAG: hypothetical protein GQ583_02355 [Methyloprofundus sp.]|nr:hypothetical protein [Methyloprofundus sp.]
MHQLLSGVSVSDPQHYVGVRLQQARPILESDINEIDEIRKAETQTLLGSFIGNGVPSVNAGFEITASGSINNFTVTAGLILVDGIIVINESVTTYLAQKQKALVEALTQPAGSEDRIDLVYLDVWDEEIGAVGSNYDDDRLINQQVGIETARRIARQWVVRVEQGVQELPEEAQKPGHKYARLALMERSTSTDTIQDNMLIDQRKLGITLADNLKIPIYMRRGIESIDSQRFANMLNGLRTTLFTRLVDNSIPFKAMGPDNSSQQRNEALILMSMQALMHLCQLGENQALANSLDNEDALAFLGRLYTAQNDWLGIMSDIGNEDSIADTFINEYQPFLGNELSETGLLSAINVSLIHAVLAQEELNGWLSGSMGNNLPEGEVHAVYLAVTPYENLALSTAYDFTYEISANFSSPDGQNEEFEVIVNIDSAFGSFSVDQQTLVLSPPEESVIVTVTLVPSGGLATANLNVVAQASRNPINIRSSQAPIVLETGELPPVANFYFYTGPLSPISRVFSIPQNQIASASGRSVLFRLRNDSDSETRTYRVQAQIVPEVADASGWSPLVLTEVDDSPIILNADNDVDVFARIFANDPGNIPPIGTAGVIISSAELIDPVTEPQEPLTVTVPFVIINPTS